MLLFALAACGGGGKNSATVNNQNGNIGGNVEIHQEANGSMKMDVDATLAENAGVTSGPADADALDRIAEKCDNDACKEATDKCRAALDQGGCTIEKK
jgi:hypothetical protein